MRHQILESHAKNKSNTANSRSFAKGLLALAGGFSVWGSAQAYVTVVGQIGQTEVVAGTGGAPGNYDFRISLSGNPTICNGQNFAYLNVTDANYNALVSTALLAKATGDTVALYVQQDGNGFCQLAVLVTD